MDWYVDLAENEIEREVLAFAANSVKSYEPTSTSVATTTTSYCHGDDEEKKKSEKT